MNNLHIKDVQNTEQLVSYLASHSDTYKAKFIFFWGHQKPSDGSVNKSCLSQWYNAGFEINGVNYPTAEHYMMAEKARLFSDTSALDKILDSVHPGDAKKLGRTVQNYQQATWIKHRFDIVVRANVEKFSQNPTLADFLIQTGSRILVEASPRDRIWGIGMGADNPDAENPAKWRGLNLLGFALMKARRTLADQI